MKKAKLIDIFSPDVEDLYSFKPDDPENFCILLQIYVGIEGDNNLNSSGETFDIEIYTPNWLLSNYKQDAMIFPKHSLIVFDFNFNSIYMKIKQKIESCYGDSWDDIAKKINSFAAWEFNDYEDT